MSCIHVIALHNAALNVNSLLGFLLSSKLLKTTTAPAGRISSILNDEYKTCVQIRRFLWLIVIFLTPYLTLRGAVKHLRFYPIHKQ